MNQVFFCCLFVFVAFRIGKLIYLRSRMSLYNDTQYPMSIVLLVQKAIFLFNFLLYKLSNFQLPGTHQYFLAVLDIFYGKNDCT